MLLQVVMFVHFSCCIIFYYLLEITPNFPVEGHTGCLVFGTIPGSATVAQ